MKSLVTQAAWAAVGAMATNIVSGFVPIRVGGWAGIGVRFGVAYLTGYIAERFVSPANAQMIAVGGAASAAGEAINMALGMVRGATGQLFAQAAPAADAQLNGYGMGDVMELPDGIARYALNGMDDIVETPTQAQYW